jgi:hypothetical protein
VIPKARITALPAAVVEIAEHGRWGAGSSEDGQRER